MYFNFFSPLVVTLFIPGLGPINSYLLCSLKCAVHICKVHDVKGRISISVPYGEHCSNGDMGVVTTSE